MKTEWYTQGHSRSTVYGVYAICAGRSSAIQCVVWRRIIFVILCFLYGLGPFFGRLWRRSGGRGQLSLPIYMIISVSVSERPRQGLFLSESHRPRCTTHESFRSHIGLLDSIVRAGAREGNQTIAYETNVSMHICV